MSKYKLENCEKVFSNKEHLIKLLDELKNDFHSIYSVVQNDGVILENRDLVTLHNSADTARINIAKLSARLDDSVDALWDHIDACKVRVSNE